MRIIGEMVENIKNAMGKIKASAIQTSNKIIGNVKGAIKSSKNVIVKAGATTVAVIMLSGSLTGCTWVDLFGKKPEQLPDETDVKIETPVKDEDIETENALPDNIPQVDKDTQSPVVGGGDETEVVIDPQPEPDDGTETEAPETDPDTDIDSSVDLKELDKAAKNLKATINSSLQDYFKQTETLASATFSVQEIVSVKATGDNLEIAFTTTTTKGKQGYNIINVGNAEHSDEVVSVVGKNYKEGLYMLPEEDLKSVLNSASNATTATGITNANMDQYYVIPLTNDTSNLNEVIIAYYKTLTPGSENCKKVDGGFEYSANVLILNASGETVKTISAKTTYQLGRNQYFETINDAIEHQILLNENKNDLGL